MAKPWKIDVPVLLIFFARPDVFEKVFESVREARPSTLLLWQDGPREGRPDDIENIEKCRKIVENIDWEELKSEAAAGYDALTQQYPALKGENIKTYLKDNGLELLNSYISSADEAMQENARKLGEIIKILCPELTDEIDSVIVG